MRDFYGCRTAPIDVSLYGSSTVNIGGTNYHKIRVTAQHWGPDGGGGVNGFSIGGPGGSYVSYYSGSGDRFAIQDRHSDDNTFRTFDLPFGPDCSVRGNTPATLRWFDDDQGTDNQTRSLTYTVYEAPFSQRNNYASGYRVISGPNTPPGGGNNVARSATITVKPGYVYIWRWENVRKTNGLQFQLPYDSVSSQLLCTQPPPPTTTRRSGYRLRSLR